MLYVHSIRVQDKFPNIVYRIVSYRIVSYRIVSYRNRPPVKTIKDKTCSL